MVRVRLNGAVRDLADGAGVPDALAAIGVDGTGVAVAVNGAVVPRAAWARHGLVHGDAVEVVTAVQGG
jgi:sulfur carrier protein